MTDLILPICVMIVDLLIIAFAGLVIAVVYEERDNKDE